MAVAEEVPEALKYQTVALKVSIHCEGCKREVKRTLQRIEGVYKVSIDLQQHKVVVTGNVPAETLVKKLIKTGKHAEPWPEPSKPTENPCGASNGKKKRNNKKKKNKNKSNDGKPNEPPEDPESNQSSDNDDNDDGSSNEASDKPEIEAPKSGDVMEEKQIVAEKIVAEKTVSNGGSRKKGKKKNRSRNDNNPNNGSEVGVVAEEAVKKAAFNSPQCNTSQLPSCVVSYRSVQPSISHGGAFYPWQTQQSSYVYSAASEGSYYIFSEENANACFVM